MSVRGPDRAKERRSSMAEPLSLASPWAVALIAMLAAVELGLLIWALFDLARRPAAQVTGGNRLLWLLLCLLVQILGPILYLAVGRVKTTPSRGGAPLPDPPGVRGAARVAQAAAPLYAAEGKTTAGSASPAAVPGGARAARRRGRAQQRAQDLRSRGGPRRPHADRPRGLRLRVPRAERRGQDDDAAHPRRTCATDAGSARVLGRDPGGDTRALIGYLPDVPAFYKWMTATQYLRFAGRLFGLEGAALEARVASLLDLAGLSEVTTRIGGYSRGMKQRLGVAQALVNAPRLLLLDEPTSALDPIGRREVLDMIASLRGRTTVFFSTHILSDVERVCDTVAIIDRGRVVEQAGIDELRSRRGGLSRLVVEVDDPARLATLLKDQPWLRTLTSSESGCLKLSVDDLAAAQREIPALIARSGLALRRLESDELSLEDVFVGLVGRGQA